jgi:hypothetical protein
MNLWRFRGSRHYLEECGRPLGVAPILLRHAAHNNEIHRVATLMAQLCERYHAAPKDDGVPCIHPYETAKIQAVLARAEDECAKLHALAQAAAAMIDEAYAAFAFAQPPRSYEAQPPPQPQPQPNGKKAKVKHEQAPQTPAPAAGG